MLSEGDMRHLFAASQGKELHDRLFLEVARGMVKDIVIKLGHEDILLDMEGEAYLKLARIIPKIDLCKKRIKPYLYAALRNMVLTYLSKENRHLPMKFEPHRSYHQNEEYLTEFILDNTPETYRPLVEFLINDIDALSHSKYSINRTLQAVFDVSRTTAGAAIDLVLMLSRLYYVTTGRGPKGDTRGPYCNPYLHALTIALGPATAVDIWSLLRGIKVL